VASRRRFLVTGAVGILTQSAKEKKDELRIWTSVFEFRIRFSKTEPKAEAGIISLTDNQVSGAT
jgi:hypothetical protein